MPHAEKCPVCDGVGIVNRTRPVGGITEYNIQCYGCKGRGWVEVAGEEMPIETEARESSVSLD